MGEKKSEAELIVTQRSKKVPIKPTLLLPGGHVRQGRTTSAVVNYKQMLRVDKGKALGAGFWVVGIIPPGTVKRRSSHLCSNFNEREREGVL